MQDLELYIVPFISAAIKASNQNHRMNVATSISTRSIKWVPEYRSQEPRHSS